MSTRSRHENFAATERLRPNRPQGLRVNVRAPSIAHDGGLGGARIVPPIEQAQRLAEVQSVYVFKSGPHSFSTACVVAPSSVRSSRVQTVRPAVQSR